MKTTELKGYGLTGVKVEFNLMDCYEASHLLERVNGLLSSREAERQECITLNSYGIEEVYTIFEMIGAFLEKIAIRPSEMPSIFTSKKEESNEKECYE